MKSNRLDDSYRTYEITIFEVNEFVHKKVSMQDLLTDNGFEWEYALFETIRIDKLLDMRVGDCHTFRPSRGGTTPCAAIIARTA